MTSSTNMAASWFSLFGFQRAGVHSRMLRPGLRMVPAGIFGSYEPLNHVPFLAEVCIPPSPIVHAERKQKISQSMQVHSKTTGHNWPVSGSRRLTQFWVSVIQNPSQNNPQNGLNWSTSQVQTTFQKQLVGSPWLRIGSGHPSPLPWIRVISDPGVLRV